MASAALQFEIPVVDGLLPRALLPLRDPARQPLHIDLAAAWQHFNTFKQDKEQTSVVFCVFDALPWLGIYGAAEKFLVTERGRAIYASEPFLPEILDDHAALRRLPRQALAHDYCDFMEREGLTAAGLVAETNAMYDDRTPPNDRIQWYIDRQRDVHDLLHVLTGYGRDALGEQCVLAYVFSQRPSLGHIFIAYAGSLVTRHRAGTNAPVLRAVRAAQKMGQSCPRIAEMSIRELLATPTEALRQKFGIRPPTIYQQVHQVWRAAGIEPE